MPSLNRDMLGQCLVADDDAGSMMSKHGEADLQAITRFEIVFDSGHSH